MAQTTLAQENRRLKDRIARLESDLGHAERRALAAERQVEHLENCVAQLRASGVSRPREDEAMGWVRDWMQSHVGEWIRIVSMVDNSAFNRGKIDQRLKWLEQLGEVRVNRDKSPPLYSWISKVPDGGFAK
jgi:hypothetical protein